MHSEYIHCILPVLEVDGEEYSGRRGGTRQRARPQHGLMLLYCSAPQAIVMRKSHAIAEKGGIKSALDAHLGLLPWSIGHVTHRHGRKIFPFLTFSFSFFPFLPQITPLHSRCFCVSRSCFHSSPKKEEEDSLLAKKKGEKSNHTTVIKKH